MKSSYCLGYQQRRVAIAEETEVMGKGIVVDSAPVATDKGTDQQQESALRLMEVGDEHLYDFILVTRNDDDLRGGMERRQMMAVEPVQQRTKGGGCLS